ncbi:hypothetical protein [Streptomyces sp. KL116D]|uniref:hypothetical protein n=1 Tax=Streptomyces sp. KL116D TaxID=3045152 RepID=UPI003557C025
MRVRTDVEGADDAALLQTGRLDGGEQAVDGADELLYDASPAARGRRPRAAVCLPCRRVAQRG